MVVAKNIGSKKTCDTIRNCTRYKSSEMLFPTDDSDWTAWTVFPFFAQRL
jgi:hypothetical protein